MDQKPNNALPIFNFRVDDLPGEIWRPVFEFEQYALISQYGRVKRIPRPVETTTGAQRYYKERIYRPTVKIIPSFKDATFRYVFTCTVSVGSPKPTFNVMRMVHYVFNEAFDIHNPEYTVIAINGNDLDIRPENLSVVYFRITRESYTFHRRMLLAQNMTVDNQVIQRRALLSCYSEEGEKVDTFENLHHAHCATGIDEELITNAIEEPFTLLQGCYWRSGKKKKIDTRLMNIQKREMERKRNGIQLTQFDLNGIPINHYYSLSEAAQENHLPETQIFECLEGTSTSAGFFLWRKGDWKSPIQGF